MSALLEFLRSHEEAFRSRNRLQSLYSDFTLQRETNPDGYHANSTAWIRGLAAATNAGLLPLRQNGKHSSQPSSSSHLAFSSGEELAKALQTREFGRPLALDAVIQDAVGKRELMPLDEFLTAKKSVYARGWGVPSPWQVVSWGARQVGGSVGGLLKSIGLGGGNQLAVGNFVVLANVEEAANAILNQVRAPSAISTGLSSRLYSRELFQSEFAHALGDAADMALSSTDFDILLTHLSRDKPLLSTDGQTIKLMSPGETAPSPITQQDKDIASLRTLMSSMAAQVDILTKRAAQLDLSVREAISKNQTVAAKSALRSKKVAENTLAQRAATLAQLEDVHNEIETAADQVAVVAAMEASAGVLANLHRQVGGTEGVEGVVDRLREEMDKVDEVGRIIDQSSSADAIDEGEVEGELEELEKAERERREAERERREAREAEVTRRRLAELEEAEGKRKKVDEETSKAESESEERPDRILQNAE